MGPVAAPPMSLSPLGGCINDDVAKRESGVPGPGGQDAVGEAAGAAAPAGHSEAGRPVVAGPLASGRNSGSKAQLRSSCPSKPEKFADGRDGETERREADRRENCTLEVGIPAPAHGAGITI